MAPDSVHIVVLSGCSGVGKSIIARLMAAKMRRCANIEVDVLRYMVIGGLVAGSAGTRPEYDLDGYREQCRLGDDNAVRLASGFAERGFSSVIEGFDDDRILDQVVLARSFSGSVVKTVLLTCRRDVLSSRWAARGWGSRLPAEMGQQERAFLSVCSGSIDTTTGSAGDQADRALRIVFFSSDSNARHGSG
ncbi:MAG: AAA family ATPase [Planctomycetes bacterium]|nr:AAA family ATPase [Planctomycetota bacterium]